MQNPIARFRPITLIAAALVAVALLAGGIYWFGPQRLLTTRTADDALPGAVLGSTDPTGAPAGQDPSGEPAADLSTVAAGSFRSLAHGTSGSAKIVTVPDGSAFLRIEDLDSLDGPDLRVYLSSAPGDAEDAAFGEANLVADLGTLRANQGNLTYEIPAGVDLGSVRSVSIWCRRFEVGFGVAGLEPSA